MVKTFPESSLFIKQNQYALSLFLESSLGCFSCVLTVVEDVKVSILGHETFTESFDFLSNSSPVFVRFD